MGEPYWHMLNCFCCYLWGHHSLSSILCHCPIGVLALVPRLCSYGVLSLLGKSPLTYTETLLFNLCLLRPEGVFTPLKYLCCLCTIVHAHALLSWFRIKSDIFLFRPSLPIFTSPVNHTGTWMSFSKIQMHFDFLLLPSRKKSDAYWVSKVSYDLGSTYHTSYPSFLLVFTINIPARETKLSVFLWRFCAFVKGTPPQFLLSRSHLSGLK